MKPITLSALFFSLLMLLSCKTQQRASDTLQYRFIHDTIQTERTRRDTFILTDSFFVKEQVRGDTVYITNLRTLTRWRTSERTDTVYKVRTDTLREQAKETITTNKKTVMQTILSHPVSVFGTAALILLVLYFITAAYIRRHDD